VPLVKVVVMFGFEAGKPISHSTLEGRYNGKHHSKDISDDGRRRTRDIERPPKVRGKARE